MIAFSYDMVGFNDTFFPEQGNVPVEQFSQRGNDYGAFGAGIDLGRTALAGRSETIRSHCAIWDSTVSPRT